MAYLAPNRRLRAVGGVNPTLGMAELGSVPGQTGTGPAAVPPGGGANPIGGNGDPELVTQPGGMQPTNNGYTKPDGTSAQITNTSSGRTPFQLDRFRTPIDAEQTGPGLTGQTGVHSGLPTPISTDGPGTSIYPRPQLLPTVGTGTVNINPTTGFGPGNDRRFNVIDPAQSDRQRATAGLVDQSAAKVAGFDPSKAVHDYTSQFSNQLETPDVGFDKVNTNVTRQAVDPNVQFRSVGTDVSRDAVDPNIQFNGVGTDVGAGPDVMPTDSAELAKYRAMQTGAADAIASGPSRSKIADDKMAAFDLEAQPQLRDQLRSVGQRAASLGRLGMGETTIEAVNPFTDYLGKRAALGKELSAETAAGDIADRRGNLDAFQSLTGQTAGLDASARGEQRTERTNVQSTTADNLARAAAERNVALNVASGNRSAAQQEADAKAGIAAGNVSRAQNERDAGTSVAVGNRGAAMDESNAAAAVATGNVNRAMDDRNAGVANAQANAARRAAAKATALSSGINAADMTGATGRAATSVLSGIEGDINAQDAAARGEQRGERTYQADTARQATEDAIRQHLIEQQDKGTNFDQQMRIAQLANGTPASTLLNASGQAGGNASADYEALQKLLGSYYSKRAA